MKYRTSMLSENTNDLMKQVSNKDDIKLKQKRTSRFNELSRNIFVSEDRKLIYHVALIDYL